MIRLYLDDLTGFPAGILSGQDILFLYDQRNYFCTRHHLIFFYRRIIRQCCTYHKRLIVDLLQRIDLQNAVIFRKEIDAAFLRRLGIYAAAF